MLRLIRTIFSVSFWKEGNKYLVSLFFITLVCMSALIFKTYLDSKKQLNQDLITKIDLISKSIRPFELNNLSALEEDLEKREYKDLKFKLQSIRSVSPDLRFIYLVQEREGKIYFVADSEPDYSPDVSPAGQEYTEVEKVLVDYIKYESKDSKAQAVISPGYTDRWGKWISVYAPMRDESGRYFVIGADVDYKKAVENLWLNAFIIALVSSFILSMLLGVMFIRHEENKIMKSKTLFVSLASHELRAPLTGVRWTTENMLSSKKLDENERKSISSIHDITVNLIGLVNDFLDYITVDGVAKKVELKKVSIVNLLNKSIDNMKAMAEGRGIKIVTDGLEDKEDGLVLADDSKLSSAFNNIISNAVKYSKDSGKVTISFYSKNKLGTVVFKDEGIGIKKKDQDKVFEGMFRTDEAKEHTKQGTGLGLNFVKKVILFHKGQISLSSKVGEGTVVKVVLPLVKG